jgi:hypothetical protein
MARIERHAIDIAPGMRPDGPASLVGGCLLVMAGMAQALQVEPIQPQRRCDADGDHMVDVLRLATTASA